MTTSEYLLGALAVTLALASLAVTASSARRLWFPAWPRALAYVAEVVVALVVVVTVSELLGSVGAFTRSAVLVSLVAVALTSVFALRRARDRTLTGGLTWGVPSPLGATAVALAVLVTSVANSLATTSSALHGGLRGFDTLWYHMPFAARFVQTESLTGLQYVGNPPTTFYPANSEVVHAVGILLVRYDVLSPLVNLAWFGLALLAGWCVGRPSGVAPMTAAAVALVASLPVMGAAETATALNDVAAFALLLAAVALLVACLSSRTAHSLAGLAAGLAVGTKLSVWPSVLALGAVAIVTGPGARWDLARRWLLGVAVAGGFWYIRNAIAVGNPLPWFGVSLGAFSLPSTNAPVDCGRTTVAHYLTDPGFIAAHILPQARDALGPQWWLVLSLSMLGVAGEALFGRTRLERGLALIAATSAVAYLFTPTTAGGENASCFAFNTRLAVPAIGLGLILLPLFLSRWRFGPIVAALAIALTYALSDDRTARPFPVLVTIILLAVIWAGSRIPADRVPRPALAVGTAVGALLVGALAWHGAQVSLHDRYATPHFEEPIGAVTARLRALRQARIAVIGFAENYPFYGPDLSNRVEFPATREGARFSPYSTCEGWLSALVRGRYDYVVTASEGAHDPSSAAWTRRYPGASVVDSARPPAPGADAWRWQLFELDPVDDIDPEAACNRN